MLDIVLVVLVLLEVLLVIECDFGWVCELGLYWGLCMLDLDVLLYGEEVIDLL